MANFARIAAVTSALDAAVRAASVPCVGTMIHGDYTDESSWTFSVDYLPEATAQDRATGDALCASFDPSTVVTPRVIAADTILARMTNAELRAFDAFAAKPEADDLRTLEGQTYRLIVLMRARKDPFVIPSPEATGGMALIKAAGLAMGLWADAATADARIAQLIG